MHVERASISQKRINMIGLASESQSLQPTDPDNRTTISGAPKQGIKTILVTYWSESLTKQSHSKYFRALHLVQSIFDSIFTWIFYKFKFYRFFKPTFLYCMSEQREVMHFFS